MFLHRRLPSGLVELTKFGKIGKGKSARMYDQTVWYRGETVYYFAVCRNEPTDNVAGDWELFSTIAEDNYAEVNPCDYDFLPSWVVNLLKVRKRVHLVDAL